MIFIELILVFMFITMGILGLTSYNSGSFPDIAREIGKFLGTNNSVVPVIFSLIELVSGVLLFASLFANRNSKIHVMALFIIFIFWAITEVETICGWGFFRFSERIART